MWSPQPLRLSSTHLDAQSHGTGDERSHLEMPRLAPRLGTCLGPDSVHISGPGLNSMAAPGCQLVWRETLCSVMRALQMVLGSTGGCQQDREAGLGSGELLCLGPVQKGLESALQVRGGAWSRAHLPFLSPELPISWRREARLREVGFLSAGHSPPENIAECAWAPMGLFWRLFPWATCPSPTSFRALRSPHFPRLCLCSPLLLWDVLPDYFPDVPARLLPPGSPPGLPLSLLLCSRGGLGLSSPDERLCCGWEGRFSETETTFTLLISNFPAVHTE